MGSQDHLLSETHAATVRVAGLILFSCLLLQPQLLGKEKVVEFAKQSELALALQDSSVR